MQESREPTQGSGPQSIKSKRQTRKRRRSLTPSDQLRSEDEAQRQNQEAMNEERIDAADNDFSFEFSVKAHAQAPRRSTRRKR